jgi:hypothetical protein
MSTIEWSPWRKRAIFCSCTSFFINAPRSSPAALLRQLPNSQAHTRRLRLICEGDPRGCGLTLWPARCSRTSRTTGHCAAC